MSEQDKSSANQIFLAITDVKGQEKFGVLWHGKVIRDKYFHSEDEARAFLAMCDTETKTIN